MRPESQVNGRVPRTSIDVQHQAFSFQVTVICTRRDELSKGGAHVSSVTESRNGTNMSKCLSRLWSPWVPLTFFDNREAGNQIYAGLRQTKFIPVRKFSLPSFFCFVFLHSSLLCSWAAGVLIDPHRLRSSPFSSTISYTLSPRFVAISLKGWELTDYEFVIRKNGQSEETEKTREACNHPQYGRRWGERDYNGYFPRLLGEGAPGKTADKIVYFFCSSMLKSRYVFIKVFPNVMGFDYLPGAMMVISLDFS